MKKILTIMALLVAFVSTGFAETWTVAGSSAVFGSNWDPSDTNNDMAYDSETGLWTLTKNSVSLSKGTTYELKVVKDGSWNNEAFPSSNYQFTVIDDGTYSVTVTFNAETEVVDVIVPGGFSYTVAGKPASIFGAEWDISEDANNDMALNSEGLYEWTKNNVELAANLSIEFKVAINHSWTHAYPDANFVVGSAQGYDGAGTYDIKITIDELTKEVNAVFEKQNAVISTVKVMGSFDTWGNGIELTQGTTPETVNTYTGTIPVSADGEEFCIKVNSNTWIKYDDVAPLPAEYVFVTEGNDNNFKLSGDYESYAVTATWTPSPDESAGWTLTLVPGEPRIAEITSVEIHSTNATSYPTDTNTPNVYTTTISLLNTLEDYEFELIVNPNSNDPNDPNTKLVYFSDITIDPATPEGWLVEGSNDMIVLKNSIAGYAYYNATATWTPGPDASKGWTLKVEGFYPRPTYTATFVNGANWEGDLYAYAWKKNSNNEDVAVTAEWPGNKMTKNTEKEIINGVEYDVWTFTLPSNTLNQPQFIIFSNGTDAYKTADLEFVNGKKYTETVPGNAEIESVIVTVPGAPVDPFDITNCKTEDAEGNYVYSRDMDLSVVLDDIPFNFTINGEALPVSEDMIDPSDNNLLSIVEKTVYGVTVKSYVLNNNNSGFAVYTATATWTPNPSATSQWKLLVVGKDPRPETTTYSIIYNDGNGWKVGDTMTGSEGVFTTTISNKPGWLFAIAPTGSVALDTQNPLNSGIQWPQIIRPVVTTDKDFEVQYFHNYSDATEVKETGGKVWKIMADNTSKLTMTFTPAESTYTIVSDATATVNISNVEWATYSLSKPFKVEDADVYIVTGVADGEANMVKLDAGAEIPAGTGVILNGAEGEYTVKPSLGNGDVAGNMLIGSGDYSYDITCVYPQEMGGGEYTAYIFANKSLGVGFYLLNSSNGNTIAPFKAFLAVPKSTGETPAPFFGFGGEGTTGIGATLNDNGEMINDNVIYDLSGRRVMNPTKGLYIINGKKVVVK